MVQLSQLLSYFDTCTYCRQRMLISSEDSGYHISDIRRY